MSSRMQVSRWGWIFYVVLYFCAALVLFGLVFLYKGCCLVLRGDFLLVSEHFFVLFFYFGKFFVLFMFFIPFFYLFLFLIFYNSFFHSLAGTWFWLVESASAKNVQKMPLKVYIIVTFSLADICSTPQKIWERG
ncbi:MAG: hypothetical protein QXS27_03905 [Candidatus Jordarchaeaceae archaeon]